MFSILHPPTAARTRRRAGIVLSALVHCVVIAALVHRSVIAGPAVSTQPIEPALVFVPLPAPRHIRPPGPDTHAPPPPLPLFDVEAPTVLTSPVGPIDADAPPPLGLPTPGGLFPLAGQSHDAGPDGTSPPGPVGEAGDGGPLDATEVDAVASALPGTAAPRYPPSLQATGIEGVVRMQFVVDTLGRAPRESVRVLTADHPDFAAAARDAILRARYSPARWHGHVVAQLVEQVFAFHIGP